MTWEDYCDLVRQIVTKHGGSYYDTRAHRSWDPGQMICAVAYGPDWAQSEEHNVANQADEAPQKAIEICQDILASGLPDFIRVSP